jgi:hypothetical protein
MVNKTLVSLIFLVIIFNTHVLHVHGRSIHRPKEPNIPTIIVSWAGNAKATFTLKDSHLEPYPLFQVFDKHFFKTHLLPKGKINYRYDVSKSVESKRLHKLVEELIEEIHQKKKEYSHFTVLAKKNFNKKKGFGMMVLKFNEYPFILKLCIETPESFVSPYDKGIDNVWFFPMGGGVNRHIAGFTRVKNLEVVQCKIKLNPDWADLVDLPRKWYWISPKSKWLSISGTNIGNHKKIQTKIPGTYAIIADEIDIEKKLTLFDNEYTKITMSLCNYLEHWIDSHIDNFVIEKETKKLVIVDTEHFPTVVGIKDKVTFNNYAEWFMFLAGKWAKDMFFRTKKDRILAQTKPNNLALI